MSFERDVSRLSEQSERTAAMARERFARVGTIDGTAKSADGAISVTVGPGGMLSDVTISSRALRSGTDAVAQQVLELAAKATKLAGDKMYRALAPVVGPAGEKHLASLGYELIDDDEQYDEPYHPR